jgi:hypothetical protein
MQFMLQIALDIGKFCYTRVAQVCLPSKRWQIHRHDCGVNISYRSHVLQADLFLKIYSSIWLSPNFLGYNSIVRYKMYKLQEKKKSDVKFIY